MKPDKRLGQHFLRDIEALEEIAAVAAVEETAGVLEIGPGEGALTGFLLRAGKPVVVIDKDARSIAAIERRFGDRVQAVQGDALDADLRALLPTGDRLPVVVGNLPYNVGTAIVRRLLGLTGRVSRLVVMLQREVANRLVAQPGTKAYGLMTVLVWLSGEAWIVRDVPPESFSPPPKVSSGGVLIELRATPRLDAEELRDFTRFVGELFQARRKMLRKTEISAELLTEMGLQPTARPENLTPDQILALYRRGATVK